ncbi:MAG: lytic murein transglycosylase, partial [Pseudomonadota bacterium]|nr:lytic murein transglycosylase [Pseudomonadota bacterium]
RYLTAYDRNRAWRRGEPLTVPAQLRGDKLKKGTVVNGRQTHYRASELKKLGLQLAIKLPADQPVGILELPLDDGSNEYWVALPNFYSVMTYNPRVFYGMAVTQLSQRIEASLAVREASRTEGSAD